MRTPRGPGHVTSCRPCHGGYGQSRRARLVTAVHVGHVGVASRLGLATSSAIPRNGSDVYNRHHACNGARRFGQTVAFVNRATLVGTAGRRQADLFRRSKCPSPAPAPAGSGRRPGPPVSAGGKACAGKAQQLSMYGHLRPLRPGLRPGLSGRAPGWPGSAGLCQKNSVAASRPTRAGRNRPAENQAETNRQAAGDPGAGPRGDAGGGL